MAIAGSEPAQQGSLGRAIALAIVFAATGAGAAAAAPIPAGQLKWASQPTPEQIARFTPAGPRLRGLDVKISFVCSVGPNHMLQGCAVAEQSPEGLLPPYVASYVASQALGLYRADDSVPVGQAVSIEFEFPRPTLNRALPSTLAAAAVTAQQVNWARMPGPAELSRFYPGRAPGMRQSGTSSIQCQVMDDLLLSNCVVEEEAPAAMGFGDALLAMAGFYKAANDTPVGQRVVFKARWTLPH